MNSENNIKGLPRMCPLLGAVIDMDICFDICLVAEKFSPLTELPTGMVWTEAKAETCMNCDEHLDKD